MTPNDDLTPQTERERAIARAAYVRRVMDEFHASTERGDARVIQGTAEKAARLAYPDPLPPEPVLQWVDGPNGVKYAVRPDGALLRRSNSASEVVELAGDFAAQVAAWRAAHPVTPQWWGIMNNKGEVTTGTGFMNRLHADSWDRTYPTDAPQEVVPLVDARTVLAHPQPQGEAAWRDRAGRIWERTTSPLGWVTPGMAGHAPTNVLATQYGPLRAVRIVPDPTRDAKEDTP